MKLFQIKAVEELLDYQFEGYLSTYGNVDRDGDVMVKGCFDASLKQKSIVPLLWNHNYNSVIGKLELSTNEKGLAAKGFLNLNDEKAANILDLLRMGALDSMSIGTIIHDYQPVEKDNPFGGWNITKAEVIEGSVVTVPANDQAVIQNVKSFEADEKQLKDLVKSAVNEAFKKERLLNILENC